MRLDEAAVGRFPFDNHHRKGLNGLRGMRLALHREGQAQEQKQKFLHGSS